MTYIDTHCHLNFPPFHRDLEAVIANARSAGVTHLINVGTDLVTSRESVNLASRYQHIFATVGVHPHDAKTYLPSVAADLERLAQEAKVVAIGEIGLDYFRNLSAKPQQISAFRYQLKLALAVRKPIVIHCRDAYQDVINLLDTDYLPHLGGRPPGVIHSFSSHPVYLQEFLKRGFFIGINNMVTYPEREGLVASVQAVPLDRLLIETDAPYLPPQDRRGQRNEPAWVVSAAEKIAELKSVTTEEVAQASRANAIHLFGLR